ncbi:MAG: SseB family protein [Frankiales bacterium]|nr:SseB family protein [Frankiales bacterium]
MPHAAPEPGAADPRLAAALSNGAGTSEVCAALVDAQVLAAVAATATGHETAVATGLRAESGAELAVLLIEAADGSRALPVFTDVQELRRWRLDARPVQLTGAQACAAALDESAEHVVIDPAGRAAVLDLAELTAVAGGWVPVSGSGLHSKTGETALSAPNGPVPVELVSALRAALRPERLRAARLLEGPDGLVLGVTGRSPLGAAQLAGLAHRIMIRLGESLPPAGVGVAQVAARGPGVPLIRKGQLRRT